MNSHILKHIHSNLYLVALGIYTAEECGNRLSMGGVINALDGLRSMVPNFHYGWLATHCSMTAKTWEIVPEGE